MPSGDVSSSVGPPFVNTLRLEHCPGCGYSLAGLPEEGVCPECGRVYDQQIVVLRGWGRGMDGTPMEQRSKTPGIVMCVICLIQLPMLFARPLSSATLNGLTPVLIGLPYIVSVFMRKPADDLPPVELRFGPSGFVRCEAPGSASKRVRIARWFSLVMLMLWLGLMGLRMILGDTSAVWVGATIVIMFAVMFGGVFMVRRHLAATYPEARPMLDGAMRGMFRAALLPWSQIETIQINCVRENVQRIEVFRTHAGPLPKITDVEIDCSDEVVSGLSRRIAEWRKGGKGA